MYNNLRFYISILMAALVVVSCSDDLEQDPQEVDFCVRAVWQSGSGTSRDAASGTRALTTTNILSDGTSDIIIGAEDYPSTIHVTCSDGKSFDLTKEANQCSTHGSYWQYTPAELYKDKEIERNNLTFTATAVIEEGTGTGDLLSGTADKDCIQGSHLLLSLHHTKALLRFAFKVADKYDAIRLIKVKEIQLNGTPCTLVDNVLGTGRQLIGYTYVNPEAATYTFSSTFDIYDKHGATSDHLIKADVKAKNTFSLGNPASSIPTLDAGYYYDLNVTLRPDSLGILSDHDNGQLTIE